jgi:hypothetical protein
MFMSPSDWLVQLYAQAPGSLFIAFYDSQGYDGIIVTRLHLSKTAITLVKTGFSVTQHETVVLLPAVTFCQEVVFKMAVRDESFMDCILLRV